MPRRPRDTVACHRSLQVKGPATNSCTSIVLRIIRTFPIQMVGSLQLYQLRCEFLQKRSHPSRGTRMALGNASRPRRKTMDQASRQVDQASQ